MAFIRRVRTASGATAVHIAEYAGGGRQRIVKHLGSAHTEAELGMLLEQARALLADPAQSMLEFGVKPVPPVTGMAPEPVEPGPFDVPEQRARGQQAGHLSRVKRLVPGWSELVDDGLLVGFDRGLEGLGDAVERDGR